MYKMILFLCLGSSMFAHAGTLANKKESREIYAECLKYNSFSECELHKVIIRHRYHNYETIYIDKNKTTVNADIEFGDITRMGVSTPTFCAVSLGLPPLIGILSIIAVTPVTTIVGFTADVISLPRYIKQANRSKKLPKMLEHILFNDSNEQMLVSNHELNLLIDYLKKSERYPDWYKFIESHCYSG